MFAFHEIKTATTSMDNFFVVFDRNHTNGEVIFLGLAAGADRVGVALFASRVSGKAEVFIDDPAHFSPTHPAAQEAAYALEQDAKTPPFTPISKNENISFMIIEGRVLLNSEEPAVIAQAQKPAASGQNRQYFTLDQHYVYVGNNPLHQRGLNSTIDTKLRLQHIFASRSNLVVLSERALRNFFYGYLNPNDIKKFRNSDGKPTPYFHEIRTFKRLENL